jgi:PAS domain S-box-containing protein
LWLLIGASLLILGSGITFAWILGGKIAATIRALEFPAQELGRGNPVLIPELPIREANAVGQSLVKAATTLAVATAALKSSEARLRGIVESAMDAIITVDDRQTIVLFNAAAATMFACPVEHAIGTPMKRFIPARFHAQHADFLEKPEHADPQANARGLSGITAGLRRGGEEFPAEVSFSSVVESDVWLHTLIIRDVTSRVKAHLALERSNLNLQQFAYVASHDLKTPLRSIGGFMQILERNHGEQLDDKARALIRRTADATRRLEQLTEDLLSYARIDAEAKQFVAVDMTEVAREVVDLLDAYITSTGAVVSVGDLPVVLGDRTQLVQLLLNLVGNGLKYCRHRAPLIQLSAVQCEGLWVFSVTDNGIGIDAQHVETVFEVFKRLHSQSEFPGTGIGLAVCRRVVEGHGGKIWVTSQPGQGSMFSFTLFC